MIQLRSHEPAWFWLVLGTLLATLLACAGDQTTRVDAVAEARARHGLALEERWVETNGVALHVVFAGSEDGPPVLLLHGLPEFWWAWHNQIGPLVERGYRVIVPDQRGHNLSEKPKLVDAYEAIVLKNDIVGLLDALGYGSVSIAGHDAGGGLAWFMAIEHPDRVDRIVSFGMGHPLAFRALVASGEIPVVTRAFYGSLAMLLNTSLPERLARFNDWGGLVSLLHGIGGESAFSDHDLPVYRTAWEEGNSFHYMMNWYRATFSEEQVVYSKSPRTNVPALVVVLGADLTVPQEPARRSAEFGTAIEVIEFADSSHWVLHEHPERAANVMLSFLSTPEILLKADGADGVGE